MQWLQSNVWACSGWKMAPSQTAIWHFSICPKCLLSKITRSMSWWGSRQAVPELSVLLKERWAQLWDSVMGTPKICLCILGHPALSQVLGTR